MTERIRCWTGKRRELVFFLFKQKIHTAMIIMIKNGFVGSPGNESFTWNFLSTKKGLNTTKVGRFKLRVFKRGARLCWIWNVEGLGGKIGQSVRGSQWKSQPNLIFFPGSSTTLPVALSAFTVGSAEWNNNRRDSRLSADLSNNHLDGKGWWRRKSVFFGEILLFWLANRNGILWKQFVYCGVC